MADSPTKTLREMIESGEADQEALLAEALAVDGLDAPEQEFEGLGLEPNQRAFLAAYVVGKTPLRAAKLSGINRATHYKWLHKSTEDEPDAYRKAFALAKEMAGESAENAAWTRAINGWMEPVYHEGILVGFKRRFDGSLLKFMIQHNIPKYSPRMDVRHTGKQREKVIVIHHKQ